MSVVAAVERVADAPWMTGILVRRRGQWMMIRVRRWSW